MQLETSKTTNFHVPVTAVCFLRNYLIAGIYFLFQQQQKTDFEHSNYKEVGLLSRCLTMRRKLWLL